MTGPFSYEIMESTKCKPCIREAAKCIEYETILEAKARCNEIDNCGIIFDVNKQHRYRLCEFSSQKLYSPYYKGSNLFLKQASKMLHDYVCIVFRYNFIMAHSLDHITYFIA